MNPFKKLGLEVGASLDELKQAFRRLAMTHHPDRGGVSAKFQELQDAYNQATMMTKTSFVRQSFEERFESFNNLHLPEFIVDAKLADAFRGFTSTLNINGRHELLAVPPGAPSGVRLRLKTVLGTELFCTLNLIDSTFKLDPRPILAGDLLLSGDLKMKVELDALEIITGTWITITDFVGEQLLVRVPAGFSPLMRLKVSGKGYNHWLTAETRAGKRGDIFIELLPRFTPAPKLDKSKVQKLVEAAGLQLEKP